MREPGGSWIKVIFEAEAEGELKEAYAKMREVNNSYGAASAGQPAADVRPRWRVCGTSNSSQS